LEASRLLYVLAALRSTVRGLVTPSGGVTSEGLGEIKWLGDTKGLGSIKWAGWHHWFGRQQGGLVRPRGTETWSGREFRPFGSVGRDLKADV
jgi:hypothetical protein